MSSSKSRSQKIYSNTFQSNHGNMLIQDGYYSPERTPVKNSEKHTPKSILRESNTSPKPKKGILINEALNEMRKYSLKTGLTEASAEKNRTAAWSPTQDDITLNRRPNTADGFFGGRYGQSKAPNSAQKNFEVNDMAQEFYGINPNVSRDGLTDFQKAYIRRLQKEREEHMYTEMLKKSNTNQTNKSLLEKYGYKDSLDQNEDSTSHKYNEQSQKSHQKKNKSSRRAYDRETNLEKSPSLNRIEEKIYELEKSLDVYSKRLRESITKQKSRLDQGYEASVDLKGFKDKVRKEQKERENRIRQSVENKSSSVPKLAEPQEIRSYNAKTSNEEARKERNIMSAAKNTENNKRTENTRYNKSANKKEVNTKATDLIEEVKHLREENKVLRSKYQNDMDAEETLPKTTLSQQALVDDIFNKEQELLRTIEKIRTKLNTSISTKSFVEMNYNETSKTPRKTGKGQKLQSTEKNYMKPKSNKQPVKSQTVAEVKEQRTRKAYGAETLKLENSNILNQGLSTSYNGFHWNADQSLKLNRNI